MNTTILKQLWIVFKIWFFSVAANTLLGTLYMTDFFAHPHDMPFLLVVGAGYGAAFSFPVLIILLIVINICIGWSVTGIWMFRIVFLSGIALTIGVFLVFMAFMGGLITMTYALLFIAILSAMIGIASQCKSLFKLGSDFTHHLNYKS